MNNRLNYISYIRVFATLLVVFFHSYAPYIHQIGLDYEVIQIQIYRDFFLIEERIQMPLFVFLSSYLFGVLYKKRKYVSNKEIINKKIKRLIIPYIVFGILIYFTVPDNIQSEIKITSHILHLWFLLMLFWCFLIQLLFIKFKINTLSQLLISFILLLLSKQIPQFLCIEGCLGLFVYFNSGFLTSYYSVNINKIRTHFLLLFTTLCTISCFVFQEYWNISFVTKILRVIIYLLTSFSYIILIFKFFMWYSSKRALSKMLSIIDENSMGIYIFHNWIMLNIIELDVIKNIINIHYILFPIVCFIFLTTSSFLLSYYIRKTLIGSYLI